MYLAIQINYANKLENLLFFIYLPNCSIIQVNYITITYIQNLIH